MPDAPTYIRRFLYPPIEPFSAELMHVGEGHTVYVEQSGNKHGIPVLFIHGGPGGGTSPMQRRFFDPEKYRIILFDQRGCGRSKPHASLKDNTTWHLIKDMEHIRTQLKIEQWLLFGGSWGSTLALLYAQQHNTRVTAIILRGVFLMMQRELEWFYGGGTRSIFPEAYENFISIIPHDERGDMVGAYYKRLISDDPAVQLEAAKRWSVWESNAVTLIPDIAQLALAATPKFALAFARLEAHYFVNKGFLECDDQILRDAHKIKHIPTTIVQGRYDAICPPLSAWELKKTLPDTTLHMIPVAGHSAFEADIIHALITTMDGYAKTL